MTLKRYFVELLPEQLLELPPEHLELATQIQGKSGERLLLFRDSLVAYKVATATGSVVRCAQVVDAPLKDEARIPEALLLEGGRHLLIETPVPA